MLSNVWKYMIAVSLIFGLVTGKAEALANAVLTGATGAVTLCISLMSVYALWCGLMNLAKDVGILSFLSRMLAPVIKFLFPSAVTLEAREALTMNFAADILGLGNAATPAGQRAVRELAKISRAAYATNDMVMLLVINNSALTLIPSTVIALRAAAGSAQPADIFLAGLLSSVVSTIVGVVLAKVTQK